MDINLDFLSGVISELNFFFTNLARSEQMKDIDMTSKTSKKATENDEDISSTTVDVTYDGMQVNLNVNTNENNKTSVWIKNFYTIAKSILPDKIRELVYFYQDLIIEQVKPYVFSVLNGGGI